MLDSMSLIELSQVFAAFVVSLAFLSIIGLLARMGSDRLIGLIAGMPTTIVLGMFFLQLSLGTDTLFAATTFFYLTFISFVVSSVVYLLLFIETKSYLLSISSALLSWLITGIVTLSFKGDNVFINITVYLIVVLVALVIIKKLSINDDVQKMPVQAKRVGNEEIVVKALIGSVVVSIVVVLSKILGEKPATLAAGAPAMFIATTFILASTKSSAYTIKTVPNIIIAASINIPVYVFLVRVFAVNYGLYFGTLLVIVIFFAISPFLYKFIIKPLSV